MIKSTLAILGFVVLLVLAQYAADAILFSWVRHNADETDEATVRSGLGLRTDFGTGCEYLESRFGGLIPRVAATGNHICKPR